MYTFCARLATIAAGVVSGAFAVAMPTANATEADDQFLVIVSNLGIEFSSPDQAIQTGNYVCDIVAEGSANSVNPVQIRSDIVNRLMGRGLNSSQAANLMWGAVDTYCPQYNAVVGD